MTDTQLTSQEAKLILDAINTAFDTCSVSEIMGDEIDPAMEKLWARAKGKTTVALENGGPYSRGLEDSRLAICEHCRGKDEPEFKAGAWFHHNVHPIIEYTGCRAGPILDLLKKAGNEPG